LPVPRRMEKKESRLPDWLASRLHVPERLRPKVEWLKRKLGLIKYHELDFKDIWEDEKMVRKALKAKRKRYLR